METKLKELEALETRLRKELSVVFGDIERVKLAMVAEEFGVRVGSIVSSKGKEYRITRIGVGYWTPCQNKPWLEGNPRRKNGTFGTARRCMYGDWGVISDLP